MKKNSSPFFVGTGIGLRGTKATALREAIFLTCSFSPVIYCRASWSYLQM